MHYHTRDASAYLLRVWGIKRLPRTLQKYRSTGEGPVYHRISPVEVSYSSADLDKWARALLGDKQTNTTAERASGMELPDPVEARAASPMGKKRL